ncbi:hypothetical protein [Nocardioides jejuensis]|uniref:hypothetical protein n=1 Tax=Nocardioides jejuensis TaxID=2502782 RepID=UPI0014049353|nr:hypothetical protein [Nocardioides jejuensis]
MTALVRFVLGLSASHRRYIYGVAIALLPLLVLAGLLPAKALPYMAPLLLALLNVKD